LGTLLGFTVEFGRYRGAPGETGHDGLWTSPEEFNIVVEVKKSETYAIKTADLLNYINSLISEKKIANSDSVLGLYVVGLPDPEIRQLENAILGEKRVDKLRIASVESLLTLAEMMGTYGITHKDVLGLLQPSGPSVDPIVEMMKHVFAQPSVPETVEKPVLQPSTSITETQSQEADYWLTPVSGEWHESGTAEGVIKNLVVEKKMYAFSDSTPNKERLSPGDWICFYASGRGIVAHARVASRPEKRPELSLKGYPWYFKLEDTHFYPNSPVVIDAELRSKLEAFKGGDTKGAWGWFVVTTRKVSKHDFEVLTRSNAKI
jgi:hypothetical protein